MTSLYIGKLTLQMGIYGLISEKLSTFMHVSMHVDSI
jgi:hypothetical protein